MKMCLLEEVNSPVPKEEEEEEKVSFLYKFSTVKNSSLIFDEKKSQIKKVFALIKIFTQF